MSHTAPPSRPPMSDADKARFLEQFVLAKEQAKEMRAFMGDSAKVAVLTLPTRQEK